MTNNEIICKAAILAGIFTEAQAQMFFEKGLNLPIHTYKAWQDLGYQVKKGEKAALKVQLWKVGKAKKNDEEGSTEEGAEPKTKMFLANAALFTFNQVEKIGGEPENIEESAQISTSEPETTDIPEGDKTYITAQEDISENAKIIKEKTGCTVTNKFAETYAESIYKQTGKTLLEYYATA